MTSVAVLRKSHIFKRAMADHYVDPHWISARLFEVERFPGMIVDPACGFGHILQSAHAAGYSFYLGYDIVDRGYHSTCQRDFLSGFLPPMGFFSIVTNPPFDQIEEFALHALAHTGARKVAMVCPVRRLPAARWLQETPLKTIYLLTPRPSMPPGEHIRKGGRIGGGTIDYCWLVWCKDHSGDPGIRWLERDKKEA